MIRTQSNVNFYELKKVEYFGCPECEIEFTYEDWNKETSKHLGVYSPLPMGAIEGWKHICPECKIMFEGSELIIGED